MKLYIVRTIVDGKAFYLKDLSASGMFAEYDKDIKQAQQHTKEEMQYVKKFNLPGLGRWLLLDREMKRVGM